MKAEAEGEEEDRFLVYQQIYMRDQCFKCYVCLYVSSAVENKVATSNIHIGYTTSYLSYVCLYVFTSHQQYIGKSLVSLVLEVGKEKIAISILHRVYPSFIFILYLFLSLHVLSVENENFKLFQCLISKEGEKLPTSNIHIG